VGDDAHIIKWLSIGMIGIFAFATIVGAVSKWHEVRLAEIAAQSCCEEVQHEQ